MKKLIILPLLALVVIVFACKDNSFLNTPESGLSVPGMAAVEMKIGDLTVTIKEAGKPEIKKVLKPQRWDGHSPIKSEVFYVFLSLDEVRAAFANDLAMLEHVLALENLKDSRSGQAKRKAETGVKLASFSANVWSEHTGQPGCPGSMRAFATTNHSSEYGSKKHIFEVYDCYNSTMLFSQDSTFDSGTRTVNWSYPLSTGSPCKDIVDWSLDAWVKHSVDGSPWQTVAYDGCNAYCDEEFYYECD